MADTGHSNRRGRALTMHYLATFIRPPERRLTITILVVALVVAVICWYFGADAWHALLLGGGITTVGLIGMLAMTIQVGDSPWRNRGSSNQAGSRSDVAELSWSLRGGSGNAVVWRVRRIARQRLARYQLDLDNKADRPRIEQLIGRRAYLALAGGKRRPARLRTLYSCLDALDALAALDPAVSTPPTTVASSKRRRTLTFTTTRSRRARER
jgi:hypothetical protein